jgi:hypothetical protein
LIFLIITSINTYQHLQWKIYWGSYNFKIYKYLVLPEIFFRNPPKFAEVSQKNSQIFALFWINISSRFVQQKILFKNIKFFWAWIPVDSCRSSVPCFTIFIVIINYWNWYLNYVYTLNAILFLCYFFVNNLKCQSSFYLQKTAWNEIIFF